MLAMVSKIVYKHLKAEFEWNSQPDGTRSDDPYSMYRTFPSPGEDLVHPSGDPHPTHDNFMWQNVNRDDYPAETNGQGEVDTVDGWLDVGYGYYVIEPALSGGGIETTPKENLQYFQDYVQNERAG